jgi:hypothetical protein
MRIVFGLGVVAGLTIAAIVASLGWSSAPRALASANPVGVFDAITTNEIARTTNELASPNAAVQGVLTGDWTAKLEENKENKLHLNFERRSDGNGRHQMGQTYDFSDLQG